MYESTRIEPTKITVVVQEPVSVIVEKTVEMPAVKVLVPGIQGPAAVERPLDEDPLETYLKARGAFLNGNNSEHPD